MADGFTCPNRKNDTPALLHVDWDKCSIYGFRRTRCKKFTAISSQAENNLFCSQRTYEARPYGFSYVLKGVKIEKPKLFQIGTIYLEKKVSIYLNALIRYFTSLASTNDLLAYLRNGHVI